MSKKKLSRRDFLRLSTLSTAGLLAAACVGQVAPAAPAAGSEPAAEAVSDKAPPPQEVVLEIRASNPEYENGEIQIWALYQEENPNVTLEFFSVTEGASQEAYEAKIAGGWTPAIDFWKRADKTNYKEFVNLAETDFPWFDRYQYDIRNAFKNRHGPDVVPVAYPFAGFIFTWQYHQDLMEEAGLDPQKDVKTWDDMKAWLAEGTAWANANPDIENFWDQAWHNWVFSNYFNAMTLAFPDGQRAQQRQAWLGEIAMNGPDSPYRHWFDFITEAYNEGWLTKNFWAREWEPDMEANYISKRSVMMIHGPWVWDKALAADPTVQQAGFPLTPPAEGQETWMQYMGPLRVETGPYMHAQVLDRPEYPEVQKAFNWWHSPPTIKLWAELLSLPLLYETDEPVELEGPQWKGIVQEIGTPGGKFEEVVYEVSEIGPNVVAQYLKDDGLNWQRWEWGSELYGPLAQGEIDTQGALDWIQKRIDENYDIPG